MRHAEPSDIKKPECLLTRNAAKSQILPQICGSAKNYVHRKRRLALRCDKELSHCQNSNNKPHRKQSNDMCFNSGTEDRIGFLISVFSPTHKTHTRSAGKITQFQSCIFYKILPPPCINWNLFRLETLLQLAAITSYYECSRYRKGLCEAELELGRYILSEIFVYPNQRPSPTHTHLDSVHLVALLFSLHATYVSK